MTDDRPPTHWIRTAEELEALCSPVRHHLHVLMEALGPCSVRELAPKLGCRPESLYDHLKHLEEAGMVIRQGSRYLGHRSEVVYALRGKRLAVDRSITDKGFLAAFARSTAAMLRLAERCFTRALKSPDTIRKGRHRNLRIAQLNVRLNRAQLAELNERLEGLLAFLTEADNPRAKKFYAVTVVTSPLFDRQP